MLQAAVFGAGLAVGLVTRYLVWKYVKPPPNWAAVLDREDAARLKADADRVRVGRVAQGERERRSRRRRPKPRK